MRIAILGFVLLLAGVARTWAAVYFVDYVGGSDANVGADPGGAWKHCPGDPAATAVAAAAFTVPGDSARRVLIRALGPTYAALGGTGTLADPKFEIYQGSGGTALANDNWNGSADVSFASTQAGAAPFVGPASADAGLVFTLPPGQCIVVVSGVNGSTGNVLLEVYLLP